MRRWRDTSLTLGLVVQCLRCLGSDRCSAAAPSISCHLSSTLYGPSGFGCAAQGSPSAVHWCHGVHRGLSPKDNNPSHRREAIDATRSLAIRPCCSAGNCSAFLHFLEKSLSYYLFTRFGHRMPDRKRGVRDISQCGQFSLSFCFLWAFCGRTGLSHKMHLITHPSTVNVLLA